MARATNTYVVHQPLGEPLGSFTVKHEAQAWFLSGGSLPLQMRDLLVSRFPDGRGQRGATKVMTMEEFLYS